jgi:hypothetical protein
LQTPYAMATREYPAVSIHLLTLCLHCHRVRIV